MTRTRSPNYPVIDLENAVDLAAKLEKLAKRHLVPAETAIEKAWGLKPGGYGFQCIAALRQFGLLQEEDGTAKRQVRLTEDAAKVVHHHPDRAAILKQAAIKPKVHAAIWGKFPDGLPPDDTIKTYLLFDHRPAFNPASVGDFIKQFRHTIAFAGLDLSNEEAENRGVIRQSNPPAETKRPTLKAGMTQAVFPLEEGEALIQMPNRFSKESYDDFKAWVDLVLKQAKRTVAPPLGSNDDGKETKSA